jgi:primosomal protein N' (replication factor Y)
MSEAIETASPTASVASAVAYGLAEVAVPLPLAALTYEVPEAWRRSLQVGTRVRVRVGNRRLVGVVVGFPVEAPAGVALRPLETVVDREPVLTPELLELARFVSSYYLAPLGEVLRAMMPANLPPWGQRRLWLTDAGALAPPRSEAEAAIVATLRSGERMSLGDLEAQLTPSVDGAALTSALADLSATGRVRGEDERPRSRVITGLARAPGALAEQLAQAGRSVPARAVLSYLAELERPATTAEVLEAVECGPGVIRRLLGLRLLQQFTQVERLDLDRHVLREGRTSAAIVLRDDQEQALGRLVAALDTARFAPFLLKGMTGAGKSEVYLRAVEATLARGRTALLLVPEIALVPALARDARERFGDGLAILHSGLGGGERSQEWERVRRGEAQVVLGPRSALFAPLADLGLLVVDEEQDTAYKQEIVPRYHARDLALVRGRDAGAVTLLVSATPSLESRYNLENGKLVPLVLSTRVGQGALPTGILVDLREDTVRRRHPGEVHFSERLRAEIDATLAAGDQVILLRNRRGYAPLLLCRACGESHRCEDCGLPRTLHRREPQLLCHYCGSAIPIPERCPLCGEAALEAIGAGTERVEEEFKQLYPEVPAIVLDRDSARRPGELAALLDRFARGEAQVMIGTQMVSKGHHFPRVALSAVLAADSYLRFPDFRAVERTYTLLTQLAGRAGRGEKPGRMVIQTYHPDHYAIRAALSGDDEAFAREELRFRRAFQYPPFTRLIQILSTHRNRARAAGSLATLAAEIAAHPRARHLRISGPAAAPLERLRGEWRFQLLVRSAAGGELHALMREVLARHPAAEFIVDVDPQQLL